MLRWWESETLKSVINYKVDKVKATVKDSKTNVSDEGLTLETLVFESFTVANLPYRPCG